MCAFIYIRFYITIEELVRGKCSQSRAYGVYKWMDRWSSDNLKVYVVTLRGWTIAASSTDVINNSGNFDCETFLWIRWQVGAERAEIPNMRYAASSARAHVSPTQSGNKCHWAIKTSKLAGGSNVNNALSASTKLIYRRSQLGSSTNGSGIAVQEARAAVDICLGKQGGGCREGRTWR